MLSPIRTNALQLEAIVETACDETASVTNGSDHDWEQHIHVIRAGAVSPHRHSVNLGDYLDSDFGFTVSKLSDEEEDGILSGFTSADSLRVLPDPVRRRTDRDRSLEELGTRMNAETTPERQRWYRSSRPASRLRRKSSALSRRPSTASSIDPALLIRKSPVEFEEDYTVPPPPPVIEHATLRPPAARNASDGTGRKSSLSLDIPRPSSSVVRRGSSHTHLPARSHPALVAARSIRQRVARARVADPLRPFATPAAPQTLIAPLPVLWSVAHDRAICVLDARNYTTEQSIRKLRRVFPELVGCHLSPSMIERRLQVLDQIPEIDYFRVGLELRTSKHYRSAGKSGLRPGDDAQAKPNDRVPSLTSSPSTGRSWSSNGTSTSNGSPLPLRGKSTRRKGGNALGVSHETIVGVSGRPMSIIDERPGSVMSEGVWPSSERVSKLGVTAATTFSGNEVSGGQAKTRDYVMDGQRTAKFASHDTKEVVAGEVEGSDAETRDRTEKRTGLKKLTKRGSTEGRVGTAAVSLSQGGRAKGTSDPSRQ